MLFFLKLQYFEILKIHLLLCIEVQKTCIIYLYILEKAV